MLESRRAWFRYHIERLISQNDQNTVTGHCYELGVGARGVRVLQPRLTVSCREKARKRRTGFTMSRFAYSRPVKV